MAHVLGKFRGGNVSDELATLKESGFLARDYTWILATRKQLKTSHYRVYESYVWFHLKYIEPYRERITAGGVQRLPSGWHGKLCHFIHRFAPNNCFSQLVFKQESRQSNTENLFDTRHGCLRQGIKHKI